MPTFPVKLDKKRADRPARLTRRSKTSKSDVVRGLVNRTGPIATGVDLLEWVEAAEGQGLSLAQRKR